MNYVGIDIGSTASKVVVEGDKKEHFVLPTGWSSKETCEKIKNKLLEMGVDVTSDDTKVVATGYGRIALLGLQRQDATVDLETVIFNGLNIRGIYGRKVWDTWYKMSTMIQAGLDISPIITHHFDIRDYEKGFEAMISGQSGKVILDWAHIND